MFGGLLRRQNVDQRQGVYHVAIIVTSRTHNKDVASMGAFRVAGEGKGEL